MIGGSSWFPEDGSFDSWKESRRPKMRYYVGIDLGLKQDPTAIAITELSQEGKKEYHVRYLRRCPLGTLYTDIATRIADLDKQLKANAEKKEKNCAITYIIDATGVGEGVSEMIIKELPNADIKKVYLTGGINASRDGNQIRLPKTQLASTLVALFDDERILLPGRSREIDAIIDELLNYEIHVSEEGHDSYGAFKTGTHDDLVTALGLAVWYSEYSQGKVVRFFS